MTDTQPSCDVELTISAKNLKDKDVFSKSDPLCVVGIKETANGAFSEIGRTECVQNCLNPEFATKIRVKYKFERVQILLFELYDIDDDSSNLSHHDFLGRLQVSLAEIVSAPNGALTRSLGGLKGNCGTITIAAEELNGTSEVIHFNCRGEALDKKDFFGKSDPFLNFYRVNANGTLHLAHRTEVIQRNLNPIWAPFKIPLRQLAVGADPSTKFVIECYDYDNDGGHDLIGICSTSANALAEGARKIPLINPKKQQKKKSYQNSGYLVFNNCRLMTEYSFLDFIRGGTQLHFAVAIDFTASNGVPTHPQSLHNITSGRPNYYQMALQSVGRICEPYSTNRQFLSYGFGAKVLQNDVVSHEFPLNFHQNNPYCVGVDEILTAYSTAIRGVTLYGPTNFSPIINRIANAARQCQDGLNYFILLIVTDGVITDVEATRAAVVNASSLPMSIIIVGVGNEDFTQMEILDSDDTKLFGGGRYAERDIVQFVPFNAVMAKGGRSPIECEERLAEEVMAEVPGQVAEWMNKRGHRPPNAARGTVQRQPQAPPLEVEGSAPPPYNSLGY